MEHLGRKTNRVTMATYILIRGYKTRENYKKAITCPQRLDLKKLKTMRCQRIAVDVELYKNFYTK